MASTVPGDQSQRTWSRATGVCVPGYKGQRRLRDRLLSPREKQVGLTGGIKEALGYDFDKKSCSICESHTAAPQSFVLIIIYQECPIRDVGRE